MKPVVATIDGFARGRSPFETPSGCDEVITKDDYLLLSAAINYQLSAKEIDTASLLDILVGQAAVRCQAPLVEALEFLLHGYGKRRRKMGPMAILHPLRTTALVARAAGEPGLLDVLGALLHDKDEELRGDRFDAAEWESLQQEFQALLSRMDENHQWYLGERVAHLTCPNGPEKISYSEYLGRILDHARQMPDLLHVKLADRLDNTLDTTVAHPGRTRRDFYESVFNLLFLPVYRGQEFTGHHFRTTPTQGTLVLSQLFKNAIFMNLLRQENMDTLDETTRCLFLHLGQTGVLEAQWLVTEVLSSHVLDVAEQRRLFLETRDYTTGGGILGVTTGSKENPLDGTYLSFLHAVNRERRNEWLGEVYADKPRLLRLALAFIAIFASFVHDPAYRIEGISRHGIGTTP